MGANGSMPSGPPTHRLTGSAREKWELVRESGVLRFPFKLAFGGRGEDLVSTDARARGPRPRLP